MKILISLAVAGCLYCSALAQQPSASSSKPVHVADNNVLLLAGDKCGVNLTGPADGTSLNVAYQPDLKKADLVLTFKKESGMTILTIENRAGHWLSYEAYMKVPKRDGSYKTSVIPVGPHLSNFESWPHPIEELVLKNFKFSDSAPGGGRSR